ncbi:EamA family transporter [Thermodesulfobacteriota bacterium]
MTWFTFACLTACAVAFRDVSVKTYEDLHPMEIAGIEVFWSLPMFGLGFYLVPTPELGPEFWRIFFISLPLNTVPYLLYLYAIKVSPLSLSVPFLSFTPLFMILTGFFILQETISVWGGLGIGCIVAGSYVLNLGTVDKSLWAPLTALFREKGSWIMMIVAFLYAFAAVLGKEGILHSSPLYFSYFFFLTFNGLLLAGLLITRKVKIQTIFKNSGRGLWIGGLFMSHITTHGIAIALGTAAYMIAVKRSSILLSVLLSWLILKEGDIKHRGLGTLLMFCGAVLITLLG